MKSKFYTMLLMLFIFAYASPALAGSYNVAITSNLAGSKASTARCSDELESCFITLQVPSKESCTAQKDHMDVVMRLWKDRVMFLFIHNKEYMSVYRDENNDYFMMDIDNSRSMRETLSVYKPSADKKVMHITPVGIILPGEFLPNMDIKITKTK